MTPTAMRQDQPSSEEALDEEPQGDLAQPVAQRRGPRALHSSVLAVFDQAIVGATNFLTTWILARVCAPDSLGIFYLAWTVYLFLAGLQANMISTPYTMYAPRETGRRLALYAGSTLLHQGMFCVVAVASLAGLEFLVLLGFGPISFLPTGRILVAVAPLLLMREYVRRFAFAHLQLPTALAIDVIASVGQLAGMLALVRLGWLSVPATYAVLGAANVLAIAAWLVLRRQPMRFSFARAVDDWRRNWAFGKWPLTGQVLSLAIALLPWLLAYYHGEAATGILAASNTLVGVANLFVLGLNNFLTPKMAGAFSAGGVQGLVRALRTTTLTFSVFLGLFFIATLLTGDWLAVSVYGPKFSGAGVLITLMALATLTDSLGITASNGLWAVHRPAASFAGDVVQVVVTLAVAIVLVAPWGANGIGVAIVAGRVVATIVRWAVLARTLAVLRISAEAVWPSH